MFVNHSFSIIRNEYKLICCLHLRSELNYVGGIFFPHLHRFKDFRRRRQGGAKEGAIFAF